MQRLVAHNERSMMTLCVIDGKQCQCQPNEGVACDAGTAAEVQAALNAEIMALRKDAERYRWLRAQREWHEMNQTQDVMWTCDMPPAEVDAAIDAAMAAVPAVGAA